MAAKGDIPYRTLGSTGERVSVIGLGGWHLGFPSLSDNESVRIIRTAVDAGVNFLDNSWDYFDGVSEKRMGRALREGYRQRVFLMTKINGRSRKAAARQLDESLRRLGVDEIDLVQHHEVIRFEDPVRIFDDDGAQRALVEAQRAGKLRYIGFTGHKDPEIHLQTLRIARSHGVKFDTVQMPLNVMDVHYRSFERMVLHELLRDGIGVLGMKPLANGMIMRSGKVTAIECLHYAMGLPVAVVITGVETMERLEQALDAARTFRPLSRSEMDGLRQRTASDGSRGAFELFKTSSIYDGTAQHPEQLGEEPEHVQQTAQY